MIHYLLDTNICIYLIKKRPESVINKLHKVIKKHGVCISSITLSELEYGVQKSNYPQQNSVNLIRFIAQFDILYYDESAAREYGKIRAELERKGKIIGTMDILIGAHALSQGLILVTNNEKEFKRIDRLRMENWTRNTS